MYSPIFVVLVPTLSQLKKMQRQDLIEAIRKHGGIQLVASKLGIYRQSKRKPKGYWSNFAVLRGELSVFVSSNAFSLLCEKEE
jgi:hypothetical protein